MTDRLRVGRIYAGQLSKHWYISKPVLEAVKAQGVPTGFANSFRAPFITEYNRQNHKTTKYADREFVKYIVNLHQRTLALVMGELEPDQAAANQRDIAAAKANYVKSESDIQETEDSPLHCNNESD